MKFITIGRAGFARHLSVGKAHHYYEGAICWQNSALFQAGRARGWGTIEAYMLRKKGAWLALAVSVSAMAWGWHRAELDLARMANERFSAKAERVRSAIAAGLTGYDFILDGGVGLFAASKEVDRTEWRNYINSLNLGKHHYGIRLIGFSKKISKLEKAAHGQDP